MNIKIQILSLFFLAFSQFAFSQIREEKLILDRKREPEVKKIEKKKTSVAVEKNYPPNEKMIQDSLNLRYKITDVPAVSDFKTTNIQGADISPKFSADYQNNYLRFGMGNYGKILADATISTILENKMEVGGDLHFLKTSGLTKLYDWSSKQSSADISAFLNSYGDLGKFNINAEYSLDDYHLYGIYALQPTANIGLKQHTNHVKINGYYDFYSNNILNDITVKTSFLGDEFESKENDLELALNLSKHSVDVSSDIRMNADLGLNLESQRSEFSVLNDNSADFMDITASPKVTFFRGNSYLMLSSDFTYLNSGYHNNLMVEKEKTSKTYWFPRAEVQFEALEQFKFYAGVDGGIHLNSYAEMLQENPYLLPDQLLKPTETKYHIYGGIRGDVNDTFKYDVSAGFSKINNLMFYKANDLISNEITQDRPAFDFANTFSAVYDDGTVAEVKGSAEYFPLENLILNGGISFARYDLKNYDKVYNKPVLQGKLGAKYTMLDKKLLLGFEGIFSSEKTTNSYTVTESASVPAVYVSTENTQDKIGGFADINLSAEYKFHKNFSIFALGNNLMNSNYQTYKGYRVLGAQILGGVKLTF